MQITNVLDSDRSVEVCQIERGLHGPDVSDDRAGGFIGCWESHSFGKLLLRKAERVHL
jgi:hypothetical protein